MKSSLIILRLLLAPAVLLAVWLCPCAEAMARKQHTAQPATHACCKATQEQQPASPEDQNCPHCNAQHNLSIEKSKPISLDPQLSLEFSLPASLLLTGSVGQTRAFTRADDDSPAHSPPIRLQTCTFLF